MNLIKSNKVFTTLGASNHTDKVRESNDYYATEPKAAKLLLELNEKYNLGLNKDIPIWECASGEDYLSNVFKEHGYNVRTSDLIKYLETTEKLDFLLSTEKYDGNIVTNPPYSKGLDFVYKALDIIENGRLAIFFLKVQFLEGKARQKLFDKFPPKYVFVSSSRLLCAKNGKFDDMKKGGGSAIAYAWYVWEKGYSGDTIIKWFN